MQTVLICPAERPAVGFLAQSVPLVIIPILGKSVIEFWLESLTTNGTRDVIVFATDRPDLVREQVGDGSAWGLRVQVRAELQERTSAQTLAHLKENSTGSQVTADKVVTLDHLPGPSETELFRSYRAWFEGILAWIPQAGRFGRVGLREIQPQVWCGLRTRVAPSAVLRGPCWLGNHVQVGPDAVVGPNAILEDGVIVDSASEICSSFVGQETFVGALTRVEDSIAWGSLLIDWRTGSSTQVPDPFLLSALGRTAAYSRNSVWRRYTEGLWTTLARRWGLITHLATKFRGPGGS